MRIWTFRKSILNNAITVVAELLEGPGMTWSWDIKKGGWNIKLIGPVLRNARRQVEISLLIERDEEWMIMETYILSSRYSSYINMSHMVLWLYMQHRLLVSAYQHVTIASPPLNVCVRPGGKTSLFQNWRGNVKWHCWHPKRAPARQPTESCSLVGLVGKESWCWCLSTWSDVFFFGMVAFWHFWISLVYNIHWNHVYFGIIILGKAFEFRCPPYRGMSIIQICLLLEKNSNLICINRVFQKATTVDLISLSLIFFKKGGKECFSSNQMQNAASSKKCFHLQRIGSILARQVGTVQKLFNQPTLQREQCWKWWMSTL